MNQHEYYKMLEEQMLTKESLQLGEAFCRMVKERCVKEINRALEVGCGYGVAATYIKDIVRSLTLCDIDELALGFNSNRWANESRIEVLNCEDLNKIQPYDLIYYFLSLHHIEDIASELRSVKQKLSHDAHLFICELEPVADAQFHIHEKSAHDGISADYLCNTAIECGYKMGRKEMIGEIRKEFQNRRISYEIFVIYFQVDNI